MKAAKKKPVARRRPVTFAGHEQRERKDKRDLVAALAMNGTAYDDVDPAVAAKRAFDLAYAWNKERDRRNGKG